MAPVTMYGMFDSSRAATIEASPYNSGENRIGRIMSEETGSERGTDADYYRIWEKLPGETRDFVPAMVALARIGEEMGKSGF